MASDFNNKSVFARIAVIAAGPVFNFILAFFAGILIVSQVGHDNPVLIGVEDGSPAQEAGLMPGDKITRINNRKISAYRDIQLYTLSHPGQELTISYERPAGGSWENKGAAEKRTAVLTPAFNEEYQAYMLGVLFAGYEKTDSFAELIRCSAYEVKYCIVSTFDSLRMLFTKQLPVEDAVTGPVGIVSMVGETVEQGREAGAMVLIVILANWVLLLSSSLGIMNLFPIPALDGGRLFFLFLELLRGKPMDPEKEGMVHLAGMMVLMALMLFVLFHDVQKLL